MSQIMLVVGVVMVLAMTALVATLSEVECQRNVVVRDWQTTSGNTVSCGTQVGPPPQMSAPKGGGFFTSAANMIGFLFANLGYAFSLASVGFGFPAPIIALMAIGLAVGIAYVALKLISLGGG